jgi:hypothetical protein
MGIFTIGPSILAIPALIVAFGPSNKKAEARQRSFILSFSMAVSIFGAYLIAGIGSIIVQKIFDDIGAPFSVTDIFMDSSRIASTKGYLPSSIGNSQQAALIAGDESFARMLSFLYMVEYISLALIIPLSVLMVFAKGAIRGAFVRMHSRLAEKANATPVWLTLILATAGFWFLSYKMNFINLGNSRKIYTLMLVAPVSGAMFMFMLTSTLVLFRIKFLNQLFISDEELPQGHDITIQRYGSSTVGLNNDESRIREIFTGGRVSHGRKVTAKPNRLRNKTLNRIVGNVRDFKNAFSAPNPTKNIAIFRWGLATVILGVFWQMGILDMDGLMTGSTSLKNME